MTRSLRPRRGAPCRCPLTPFAASKTPVSDPAALKKRKRSSCEEEDPEFGEGDTRLAKRLRDGHYQTTSPLKWLLSKRSLSQRSALHARGPEAVRKYRLQDHDARKRSRAAAARRRKAAKAAKAYAKLIKKREAVKAAVAVKSKGRSTMCPLPRKTRSPPPVARHTQMRLRGSGIKQTLASSISSCCSLPKPQSLDDPVTPPSPFLQSLPDERRSSLASDCSETPSLPSLALPPSLEISALGAASPPLTRTGPPAPSSSMSQRESPTPLDVAEPAVTPEPTADAAAAAAAPVGEAALWASVRRAQDARQAGDQKRLALEVEAAMGEGIFSRVGDVKLLKAIASVNVSVESYGIALSALERAAELEPQQEQPHLLCARLSQAMAEHVVSIATAQTFRACYRQAVQHLANARRHVLNARARSDPVKHGRYTMRLAQLDVRRSDCTRLSTCLGFYQVPHHDLPNHSMVDQTAPIYVQSRC